MVEFTRRTLMATSVAAALGASVSTAATAEPEDGNTPLAPTSKGQIDRFATTALGAEVTGPEVTAGGTLIFSLQHPSRKNPAPFNRVVSTTRVKIELRMFLSPKQTQRIS
jgi:hypothetical protein